MLKKIFIVIFALSTFGIASSYANRCIWNSVMSKVDCCRSGEEALLIPGNYKIQCLQSNPGHIGNRCFWNAYLYKVDCCPVGKEVIWNKYYDKKECY